ncbi:MAG TPA: PrsW family intramembrane metalloprotease [Rubrobacteraceae bacterium]|nr:PrsW family intramembrane metalloprotease [Rubrobacteraceae bacterium]
MSVSLVGVGILQAVVYLLFIRAIDLYEREEFKYVIPVFVWGFSAAVVVSLVFNTIFILALSAVVDAQVADLITAVLVAPVVEECAKGLALLIAFVVGWLASLRQGYVEFSGVMDGIVYGSAVGFGFSIAEDLIYYAQFGEETFVVRRIFGGFAHAAFTSLTGIGIGLIPWVRWGILKVLLPLLGLLGAIVLHATFNFTATLFGPLAYIVLFFVLLSYVLVIVIWLAVERWTIRRELLDEVAAGTISAGEYAILPTYFARAFYYLGLLFTGRFKEWRRAHKVHQAAVDLAFTKRLSRHSYTAPQQRKIQLLRRRIADLRGGRTLLFSS